MSAIDIVRAVMDGDLDTATAECGMELDARREELLNQGTEYILNSIGDDISSGAE
ncbi:hypothetical protein FDI76_gp167 [Serratia phage vB_Sru_IME250]|uniref:Uncharacterized protein n=1 Tax=Serratia phage vB_Sru_IME250 TaxID=1852640 RepID=A0A1J0MG73_9CAUD|nr:hypothetical protein FDI76_gp167 [Serratia phage vB_Sru_IME250]ANM47228.1 hypothetical protein [Serratia phage vB_Sru_IME250]APD20136.1 hypothetical protein [Serratia phage vB_Sru_IME250]